MLQLTPHHRLLLAVNPVDFRRVIDGIAASCQLALNEQPHSGTVFVFAKREGHKDPDYLLNTIKRERRINHRLLI